jgi:hypothetical protein
MAVSFLIPLLAPNLFAMAMQGALGPYPMTREGSGTAWQPDSTPHQGIHRMTGDWMTMVHGYIQGVYTHQGSDRGDEKWFGNSMLMVMTQHPWGQGTFGFHTMISLDPATIRHGAYPDLLQSGETADGAHHLTDQQHPHDFLMELAGSYSYPISDQQSVFAYVGYPGEPALGPVAFMHRFSGAEIPEAPITHHWLDSTHITFGVATLGYVWDKLKFETSRFTGREPNQYRWDVDPARFDSYSGRLSFNPAPDWSFQASYGHIVSPEQLKTSVDQNRWTASATYNRPFHRHNWQSTIAWGQNQNLPGRRLNAYLAETTVQWNQAHSVMVRAERATKDELFPEGDPLEDEAFTVDKIALGYLYDFAHFKHSQIGVGGVGTLALLPSELEPSYGTKRPLSFLFFVRVKLI